MVCSPVVSWSFSPLPAFSFSAFQRFTVSPFQQSVVRSPVVPLSRFRLLHSPREGGRNPGPAVQGSRFGVGCSMLDVGCFPLPFLLSAFPISAFPPPVLWPMVNSRWSPRPSRTLDFRLQTLDSFPSPRRLVCHSPERRRKPCQGESTSQPGRPLAELSILKAWQNPAEG